MHPLEWPSQLRSTVSSSPLLNCPLSHKPFSGLFPKLSEPACFDKEGAALIDFYRYVLVLLCDKEHVVDGLSGHHLALFTSS